MDNDFLQAASNAIAGSLSGPVDMIDWLLRAPGRSARNLDKYRGPSGRPYQPGEDLFENAAPPTGGSEQLNAWGITKPVDPNSVSAVLGTTAGLLLPFGAQQYAPQIANALDTGVAARSPAITSRATQRGAFKLPGGNVEPPVYSNEDLSPPVIAWKDKQLANYLRKDYGSANDPVATATSSQVPGGTDLGDFIRRKSGMDEHPGDSMEVLNQHAQFSSKPYTDWDMLQGKSLPNMHTVRQLRAYDSDNVKPWMLDPTKQGEIVHQFLPGADIPLNNLNNQLLKHLTEVTSPTNPQRGLLQASGYALTPEQLSKTSVADALRNFHKSEVTLNSYKNPSAPVHTAVMPVVENPDGSRWVQFNANHPDLHDAMRGEGNAMHHCIGTQCDMISDGMLPSNKGWTEEGAREGGREIYPAQAARVYSLRNPSGKPTMTIHMIGDDIQDLKRFANAEATPDDIPTINRVLEKARGYGMDKHDQSTWVQMPGSVGQGDVARAYDAAQQHGQENPALWAEFERLQNEFQAR